MCDRCIAEAADYAAKAEAAYAVNRRGAVRVRAAMGDPDALVQAIADTILHSPGPKSHALDIATAVIELVHTHDEQRALMRDAADDHTAQNNEGQEHAY